MGDLLNAPLLHGNLELSAQHLRNLRKVRKGQRSIIQHMPNSVVSRYLNRVGEDNWGEAPNGAVLRDVLCECGLISGRLEETERLVSSEKNLVVQLRIGDKGTRYAAQAKNFLSNAAHRFELVLLLFGLHARHNLYDDQGRSHRNRSLEAIQEILREVPNAWLLVEGSPDEHLHLMHRARHLLLTTGGFSALGGLVCRGRVYLLAPAPWFGKQWRAAREIVVGGGEQ
jgi:hypothetical protein